MAILRVLAILVAASFAALPARAGEVERGRYLATLGDCAICHTAPGQSSRPYAGGYPLHATFGTVYSTNITPDDETGIGRWSKDRFYRALHDGIGADGRHLYPAFPYVYFARLPRADVDAIYDYLRTVKPVRATPPPNNLMFPTNLRFGMAAWNALFLDRTPLKPDPSKSAPWNRGAAIVNGLGHCGGCHTPKNVLFADKPGRFLQGETIDGWYAPNLTGSRRTGLGEWTAADIATYLETGSNRFGRAVGAMQDVVRVSTSHMTDADRAAIAAYLKSLPPAPEAPPRKPDAAQMQLGQAVFAERCAVCHATDARSYPPLAHNAVARLPDPATVLRVILQGSQSVPAPGKRPGFSMPAFPVLTNEELAAVATYVRNSWDNDAGPVSPKEAAAIRKRLEPPG
ncbi:MAG TPA: cytochrome c [Rhizomicrobium sp.]|nr:cytochrome c [Rhizomicrobium sp.]